MITPKNDFSVTVPALGGHMIYPVLMACAIGERFGMTGEEMKAGIEAFVPTRMRMNVIHQGGDITILDDTYNANPQSMRAALEILSQTEGAYRAAVLGDMFELGDLGPELHRSMGSAPARWATLTPAGRGELAWNIYDAAHQSGITQALYARDRTAAKELLPNLVRPGAVILVKSLPGHGL